MASTRKGSSTGEQTEKAIRAAAVRVIAKHGFQAASLRDIAKEVGIQAPSLYNYIKSKEKLLFELLHEPVEAHFVHGFVSVGSWGLRN